MGAGIVNGSSLYALVGIENPVNAGGALFTTSSAVIVSEG